MGGGGGGGSAGGILGGIDSLDQAIVNFVESKRIAKLLREQAIALRSDIYSAGLAVIGKQRTAYAASGVTQEGSPQEIANQSMRRINGEAYRQSLPLFEQSRILMGTRKLNVAHDTVAGAIEIVAGAYGVDLDLNRAGEAAVGNANRVRSTGASGSFGGRSSSSSSPAFGNSAGGQSFGTPSSGNSALFGSSNLA